MNGLDKQQLAKLQPLMQKTLAQCSLLDFATRVCPGFQDPPHIRLIADLLERVGAVNCAC